MGSVRSRHADRIRTFALAPGDLLAGKYLVQERLGRGWEGEVYLVRERGTGVERSAKLFFPHRNAGGRTARYNARKLHKLRQCSILIKYHTQETIRHQGRSVTALISDYVDGEPLPAFLRRQPGGRLDAFQALHLLHALAAGIEDIHASGEYHGDLHAANVIVSRRGLGFEVKLVDLFPPGRPTAGAVQDDVCDLVRLLYDCGGGKRTYRRQPPEFKDVCCGLKRSLIARKFRTAGELRWYLENLEWSTR
ncbi:MAG TPA: protein kinase [Candidatus Krumholzibacteria bacterium]|nr:protein kinase [Candidatus Krumholzibacteria bacterium]HPD70165.1 protein kinase [Candidatus Krumholzibacteria bacterium]HRY40135.1 protein kinase [Candidatus Krumholzibacteria bacterium]